MRKFKGAALFIIMLCGVFIMLCNSRGTEASIVLDPGHDSTHSGANANGIAEEVINLKIARYCYEELQNYQNVGDIYMTRNGEGCPYPGTTSTKCNKKRVEFSKSVGANLYVSIHNNSSSSSSAKGASVYYPNGNYRSSIGKAGERLANIVQSHLIALGLENRGTHIRNSEDNTRYADGSLADYYGVIKNSKLAGFTAIIIEHAFLTNSSDVANYLSTDAQLKLLGIADATAIAEYYGLSKKPVWDRNVSAARLNTSFTADYKNVTASISGLSKAPSVTIAVWSEKNGQDDLKWYIANKDSAGNWVYNIPVSDFKRSGKYNVHVYGGDGEVSLCACMGSFNVDNPTTDSIAVKSIDLVSGTFDIDIKGVSAKPGIDYVKVAVWTKGDQSDLKWITAKALSGDNFQVTVNLADYNYTKGKYNIHAYAEDKNGIFAMTKGITHDLTFKKGTVNASVDLDDVEFTVDVLDLPFQQDISYVKVAVWSDENAQDDMVWYTMKKNENKWTVSDYFMPHLTDGKSYAHVYAYMKNGTSIFSGDATFEPNQRDVTSAQKGKSDEGLNMSWSGNRVNIFADKGKISLKDATASGDGVNVSGEAADASPGGVNVSGEAADASPGGANVSREAIEVSPGGASVSEASVLVIDKLLMREKVYSIKEHISYFKAIHSLFDNQSKNNYRSFIIRGVDFTSTEDRYLYDLNDKIRVQFKLPTKYLNKDVAVFELKIDDNNVTIGTKYDVTVTEDGYAQINTDKLGDFIIASDEILTIIGDLDYSGDVRLDDVVILLKSALALHKMSDKERLVADIDGDGKVTLNDVQLDLKMALGLI